MLANRTCSSSASCKEDEAFSPSPAVIEKAKKVCAAFENDKTGLVVIDGELIELPVVRSSYRILAIAERLANR